MTAVDPTLWHTMLVAGYGPNNAGYYAVDVTNPDASTLASGTYPPDSPLGSGPHFRWQLTTMPSTNTNYHIFGSHSGTPAITTLFMDPGDGGGTREIGVAILPGGYDGAPTTSAGSGSRARAPPRAATRLAQPPSGYAYPCERPVLGEREQPPEVDRPGRRPRRRRRPGRHGGDLAGLRAKGGRDDGSRPTPSWRPTA